MQETFEKAKFQADRELVEFRQATTLLLRKQEGEAERAFLGELNKMVGRCLGMGTMDFKASVLMTIDNLVDLRRDCAIPAMREQATSLLFILTRCSRLAVTETKIPYSRPTYLDSSASLVFISPRRLSGDLGTLQTGSLRNDRDEGFSRAKTMPNGALKKLVDALPPPLPDPCGSSSASTVGASFQSPVSMPPRTNLAPSVEIHTGLAAEHHQLPSGASFDLVISRGLFQPLSSVAAVL
jgi:hypothetical protein